MTMTGQAPTQAQPHRRLMAFRPGQAVRGWPRRVAAAAVAAAAVAAALAGAGPAAAKPKLPALAFTPSSYDYTQVTTGQTASHT